MVFIGDDDDGCGFDCLGEVAKAGSDGIVDGFVDGLDAFDISNDGGDGCGDLTEARMDRDEWGVCDEGDETTS